MGRRWLHRNPAVPGDEPEELHTTPAARTSLDEAARLAGRSPVGSHHLLLAALADPETAAAKALVSLGLDLDQAKEALRNADVTGTSDEPPEERGRRYMRIRATGDAVMLEATDQELVSLASATAEALGGQAGPPITIRGDLPVASSLAKVWQALRDSLEDIRRSATATTKTDTTKTDAGKTDPPGQPQDEPADPS
ncbi:MAG TPA: Clp protease N-terminal domain-containing protein [Streptosporangiaceae bacterium]|nr:Clp protease N-terminal domain-containing protein [Streptosporangiaceae bacterium]